MDTTAPASALLDPMAPVALAKRALLVRVVADGRRLGMQFSNAVDDAGQRAKKAGAVWFAPRRLWVMRQDAPARSSAWLKRLFVDGARHLDLAGIDTFLQDAIGAADPDYFTQVLDIQIFPLASGGHAVSANYDLPVLDAMHALGGRFHKFAAAWEVRHGAAAILKALRELAGVDETFVFVHERFVVLEDLVAPPPSEAPIQVPAATPEWGPGGESDEDKAGHSFLTTVVAPMQRVAVDEAALLAAGASASMRDYQVAGTRFLLGRTSALLADDMGLGKSRQAVVAGRLAAGDERVLVACPASLRINWQREILAVYPEASIGIVGEDRLEAIRGCRWVIANYERLGGLVREAGLAFKVFMIDEAHYLKEHEAGRTRNAFILAERIPRRFLITGTPLLSREIELHTLLRLSGHRLGAMPLKDFRTQYAGDAGKRGALASELSEWMLRRRKDVLTDLGQKHHQVRYVSPAQGRALYDEIMADMSLTVMPKITKLRQALEMLKFDFLVETIQSLGEGDKIIVFAEYMNTVNALKEAVAALGIGVVSLVGADAGAKRQRAVDAFQQDARVRVFIGTTSAAGVGITLTAANYVTFASEPWTPALKRQAEDRAYRLGQRRDVFVITPIVPNTIDEQVHLLLESKTALEHDVVEAVRAELVN
jgi:SNF2-related domain